MRQTNWSIITGAPCSGKTAVISEIEHRGFRVIHEVARAYIDEQLKKGLRLNQIKADALQFESHILNEKVRIQALLPTTANIFFDRGIPDSIAYYRLEGLDPTEPLKHSKSIRYRHIFFFERLDFLIDDVRSETERIAARLNDLLIDAYVELGYEIEMVPVMPVNERVEMVLKNF